MLICSLKGVERKVKMRINLICQYVRGNDVNLWWCVKLFYIGMRDFCEYYTLTAASPFIKFAMPHLPLALANPSLE